MTKFFTDRYASGQPHAPLNLRGFNSTTPPGLCLSFYPNKDPKAGMSFRIYARVDEQHTKKPAYVMNLAELAVRKGKLLYSYSCKEKNVVTSELSVRVLFPSGVRFADDVCFCKRVRVWYCCTRTGRCRHFQSCYFAWYSTQRSMHHGMYYCDSNYAYICM